MRIYIPLSTPTTPSVIPTPDSAPHGADPDADVREVLEQYVRASREADMPQTAAITLALSGVAERSHGPLPEAALRLGRFLLQHRGRN